MRRPLEAMTILVVLLAGGAWWHATAGRPPAAQHRMVSPPPPAAPTSAPTTPAPGTASAGGALEVAARSATNVPAPGADQGWPGDPPHPITAERQRLQREVRLVAALDDAVDRGDATRVEALVATHRGSFPDDAQHLRGGYSAIAGCLGHPGPESRATAQSYYDAYRASPLRRQVRRHCLDR